MPPLRLVHYLDSLRLELGGVVRAVMDMAKIATDRGAGVRLLTSDATDAPPAWREGEAGAPHVQVVPPMRLFGSPSKTMADAIAWADVVHLHTPWSTANVPIARTARRAGKPYVLTVHGMLDDWSMTQRRLKKQVYLALFGRRLLNGAAAIHCTAEAERQQAAAWYSARSVVLPLIFDQTPYLQLPGSASARQAFAATQSPDAPVALFLSRVHPKKGVEHLIDAASQLRDRHPQLLTIIAGPEEADYGAQLRERIAQQGLAEHVRLIGPVRGELKLSLYELADVFVLPTSQENFGLVLIEAMACGTPVVTTRGTDIWSEIQGAGATIVPQEAGAIAEAMSALLTDTGRRQETGSRARRWVLERFDSNTLGADYEAMYRAAQSGTS